MRSLGLCGLLTQSSFIVVVDAEVFVVVDTEFIVVVDSEVIRSFDSILFYASAIGVGLAQGP